MMRAAPYPARWMATGLALSALAACSSSPSTTLLTLDAVAPPAGAVDARYRGPAIAVPAVHVPSLLDRAEFLSQISAGTAKVDDFARWAAPLGILTRDALVRDLTARLPEGSVLPPGTPASKENITVDVTILSFNPSSTGATMQIAYRIGLHGSVRQVSLVAPQTTFSPAGSAQAYAAIIANLADRLVRDLALAAPKTATAP